MHALVAKTTLMHSKKRWRVYGMQRDLKWHRYEPADELHSPEAMPDVDDRDEYCCFFG